MFHLTNKIAPMAYNQWTRDIPIEGKRGNIYDRNGNLIVGNSLSPSVAVIKRQIKDKDYVVEQLSTILNCDKGLILKHINKSEIWVKEVLRNNNIDLDYFANKKSIVNFMVFLRCLKTG